MSRRAVLALGLWLGLGPAWALGPVHVPASDDALVLVLPEGRALRDEQRRARALEPADWEGRLALVRRALDRARVEGEPRLAGQAEAWLAAGTLPWPAEARLLAAELKQWRHDFAGALAELDVLEHGQPGRADALWLRAQILRVQGRLPEARRACLALLGRVGELEGASCMAATAQPGERAALEGLLERVLARGGEEAPELRAHAHALLGELAERRGDAAAAERAYKRGLGLAPEQHATRLALAELLREQGRWAELAELTVAYPGVDGLALRHAHALRQLERPEAAETIAGLRERLAAEAARGEPGFEREAAWAAWFLEGDAEQARDLARRNWQLQRELPDERLLVLTGAGEAP
ncbi:MAG: hypothetical protein HYV16_08480 [Gammaproteobacteria bacterium]|nr:hypothetical protein [Gammaproteobacteria bacterium]